MQNKSIEFLNVSKSYVISRHRYRTFSDNIDNVLKRLKKINKQSSNRESFWAVRNLSFNVERGVTLGIIGKNGSGKSTILKLISKIIYPQKGKIKVNGRIGAFIELGAGLHPELTGAENIYLYGSILGMKRKEITQRFNEIVDFAEIRKFLDTPIKRYSSGMYSRLGFSVCAFCNPDILLVDEVLAVGDSAFQKKCLKKMQEFAKSKKTIVFISHDLTAIQKICDRVILLDRGKIVADGSAKKVIRIYLDKYAAGSLE